MAELVPYNTGGTLYFPLIGSGTAAWSTAASGSLVGTNILVSKDGGAFASSTNTGTVVGSGLYQWVYTTSEMSAAQITVLIGAGTLSTVVEYQAFQFRTYGSANAFYLSDIFTTLMSGHTIGTVSQVLTGTISTVTSPIGTVSTVLVSQSATVVGTPAVNVVAGTVDANLIQILATAVVATSGTLTNIGTVGTAGTALGTITASGTVTASTLLDIGAISTLTSGTFDANLVNVKGTAVGGTQGTVEVSVAVLTAARATLTAVPAGNAAPLAQLDWVYNMSRNQVDQVTSTQLAYNAGNTLIATAIVSDDGGSYRRGSFV